MNKIFQVAVGAVAALIFATGCGEKVAVASANCDADIQSGFCHDGGTKCDVKVEVSACGVKPTTTPDALHVCKQNTKITWTLVATGSASGAHFASNGIDFKGNPEFPPPPRAGATDFEWKDKHSKADPANPAKYDLNILAKDGSLCVHQDPVVVNE